MTCVDQQNKLGSVRFMTWNVRGLGGPIKRTRVLSCLKSAQTDIAFLQETHLCLCDHTRLRKPWDGQVFRSGFNSRLRGTAIASPNGRYIVVVGMLSQTPLILACIYAPNWDCPNFMTLLFSLIPSLNSQHLIFGGDLNLVSNPALDKSNPKNITWSNMARALSTLLLSTHRPTRVCGCVAL